VLRSASSRTNASTPRPILLRSISAR